MFDEFEYDEFETLWDVIPTFLRKVAETLPVHEYENDYEWSVLDV